MHNLSIVSCLSRGYHLVGTFGILMTQHIHENLFRYVSNSFLIFLEALSRGMVYLKGDPRKHKLRSIGSELGHREEPV